MFGLIDGGVISNFTLADANVLGSASIGGVAIKAKNAKFEGIKVTGDISSPDFTNGGSAAGLVVEAYDCVIRGCSVNVRVKGKSGSGAMIGRLYGGTVEGCQAAGEVYGSNVIGGFAGAFVVNENTSSTPTVTDCSSNVLVTVLNGRNQGNDGAGFVGLNSGYISRCFSTGNVHVTSDVGSGFCDTNYGIIDSCYATGDIYNEEYGVTLCGFVNNNGFDAGYHEYYEGTILNCFCSGRLNAPEAPSDIIAQPTRYFGFAGQNWMNAGAVMANCYYDSAKNTQVVLEDGIPVVGSYGVSTDYMLSEQFVADLNNMAAIMGTFKWSYSEGNLPVPTQIEASPKEIIPFFGGGEGTESAPWQISTKEHLENLAFAANHNWNFKDQYFIQTADIALNAPRENWGEVMPLVWTPVANYPYTSEGNPKCPHFCGVYDGGMHTVSNMYVEDPSVIYAGLFGVLGGDAVIRNLGVTDVWMESSHYSGAIAGTARIHNDYDRFLGEVTISHCWSDGDLMKGSTGGILGKSSAGGLTYLNACYSTANSNKYAMVGDSYIETTEINGCWFAGTLSNSGYPFTAYETVFESYADAGKFSNAIPAEYARSTEYMQSKRFVNDLNYAASYKNFEGEWAYNQDNYPSFEGEKPTVSVTLDDNVNQVISFKAFKGTTLSAPVIPQREGYHFTGWWYTDGNKSVPFDFGVSVLTDDITLYGGWEETIEPDYSIFRNKFAKTFTVTTPAQLYAFANIVRGDVKDIDLSDFSDKLVQLGNDIVLNDINEYDKWGNGLTPASFPGIGSYGKPFNGTFDGNGYSVIGMYTEGVPFISEIGTDGSVENLILKNAYSYISDPDQSGVALFANDIKGAVSRCGVEGCLNSGVSSKYNGLAGFAINVAATGSLSECYADVSISCIGFRSAGLVRSNYGTIENCYAVGDLINSTFGDFGGIIGMNEGSFTKSYSSISLEWNETPDYGSYGGAYYYNSPSGVAEGYYDKQLLTEAFYKIPSDGWVEAFAKGIGLSSEEMKKMASYPTWDFENVWGRRNDINDGYPYLRWTNPGLDNDKDSDVTGVDEVLSAYEGEAKIYDLTGVMIYSGDIQDSGLGAGIYIIVRGDNRYKVIVK